MASQDNHQDESLPSEASNVDAPFIAKLADREAGSGNESAREPIQRQQTVVIDGETVFAGSPFAPGSVVEDVSSGSIVSQPNQSGHPELASVLDASVLEDGAMRYTAMGAVTASAMVVFFAAASLWWFPSGGTLIATLGCGLSVFGLFSGHRIVAASLLVVHAGLFIACYSRALA